MHTPVATRAATHSKWARPPNGTNHKPSAPRRPQTRQQESRETTGTVLDPGIELQPGGNLSAGGTTAPAQREGGIGGATGSFTGMRMQIFSQDFFTCTCEKKLHMHMCKHIFHMCM